ncbi:MAG: thermonuclease family protein [Chitinophagaceae bacterium]|nr:thermonuclease family protein [Chitinophagaceae bacterium]
MKTNFLKELQFPQEDVQATYKVTGVKDGDTFVLLMNGKQQVVRFAHIDCPEKGQPYGNKAKKFVSDLCFGAFVSLIQCGGYDRNKRLIAEVILPDGRNLNKELMRHGLAWHFKKYSTDEEYARLETQARNRRIGLWSEPNPVAPWLWRKQMRKKRDRSYRTGYQKYYIKRECTCMKT